MATASASFLGNCTNFKRLIRRKDRKPWNIHLPWKDPVNIISWTTLCPVSYTHLDVYKRQILFSALKSLQFTHVNVSATIIKQRDIIHGIGYSL